MKAADLHPTTIGLSIRVGRLGERLLEEDINSPGIRLAAASVICDLAALILCQVPPTDGKRSWDDVELKS